MMNLKARHFSFLRRSGWPYEDGAGSIYVKIGLTILAMLVVSCANAAMLRARVLNVTPSDEPLGSLRISYIVDSDVVEPVSVAVVAYEEGNRSVDSVIVAKSFVNASLGDVGAGVPVNIEHVVTWDIAKDADIRLAKLKIEVLALTRPEEMLPLSFVRFNYNSKTYVASVNIPSESDVFNAKFWLKAKGYQYQTMADIYSYMGYDVLSGEDLAIVNEATRLNLTPEGDKQYAMKKF